MPISTIGQNGLNAPLSLTSPNLGTPSALVLTNATGLPAAQLTGTQTIPKATLPTGSVLQVVNFTSVSSVTINTNVQTATGYSASITPTSATSKVLISFYCSEFRVPGVVASNILLYKNGSVLTTVGREFGLCTAIGGGTFGNIISFSHLDSPATTSSTTYAIYAAIHTGTGSLEFIPNGSNNTLQKNLTLILTEIAA